MGASNEAEEAIKHWTFQVQNLPHSSDSNAVSTKCPSSIGCITLSVMYAAEALLLSCKPVEARTLLGSFVNDNAVSRGLESQSSAVSEQERVPSSASSSMGGLTSPTYLGTPKPDSHTGTPKERASKGGEEKEKGSSKDSGLATLVMYPPSELPRLGDTQCMLYTNLAALHVQDGNLEEAERSCEKALALQHCALLFTS